MDWIQRHLNSYITAVNKVESDSILKIVKLLANAFKNNKNIYVIGNGGSAANASHFAEDLGKGGNDAIYENSLINGARDVFGQDYIHPGYFKVISLTDSVPYTTAIGNDYNFDDIFLRQLKPLADEGDILIGMSVSGRSPNIVKAFEWAKENGLKTIALTGLQATQEKTNHPSIYELADLPINIVSTHYAIVEDIQMIILHTVCYYIMDKMK